MIRVDILGEFNHRIVGPIIRIQTVDLKKHEKR